MRILNPILKSIVAFAFLAFLLTSCCEQKSTPPPQNIEETIIALEHKALDRWSDGDPVGYAANFADDATYFDDIGAKNRISGTAEIQEYFTSLMGLIPKHKYELKDTKVQVYGDVAILTTQYLGESLEGEKSPPWKATSVYHKKDGKWQVVHANWSLVKPED